MNPAFILFGTNSHRTIHLNKAKLFFSATANGELAWRGTRFLACLASVEICGDAAWLLSSSKRYRPAINGQPLVSPMLLKDTDIVQLAGHTLAYVEAFENLDGSLHYGLLRRAREFTASPALGMGMQ